MTNKLVWLQAKISVIKYINFIFSSRPNRYRVFCNMFRTFFFTLIIPIITSTSIEQFLERIQNDKTDVIFILDRSKLTTARDYYINQKPLIKTFIRSFMRISQDHSRIAILSYGKDVTTEIDGINQNKINNKCFYVENNTLWNDINYTKYPYSNNGSDVVFALKTASTIFENSKANRNRMIFLFSNGPLPEDNQKAKNEINNLKISSIDIFVAGTDQGSLFAINNGGHFRLPKWQNAIDNRYAKTIANKQMDDNVYVPTNKRCKADTEVAVCNIISGYSACLCNKGYYRQGLGCSSKLLFFDVAWYNLSL